jgi:hypothetical protein
VKTDSNVRTFYVSKRDSYIQENFNNKRKIITKFKKKIALYNLLVSGNACYHPDQNLLSSRLLSKYTKIKIYRTIILLVVLCGCKTWSLMLRE